MDLSLYIIIAVTFFGFVGLAFVLLYPVYRFMNKEQKISDEWTPEAIARRQLRDPAPGSAGGDGATVRAGGPGGRGKPPAPPEPAPGSDPTAPVSE